MYNDQQFLEKVNGKPGNIKYFRWLLRNNNMIKMREHLTDKHIELYKQAEKLREEEKYTWEEAFKEVLDIDESCEEDENKSFLELVQEIDTLRKIITEQDVRIRGVEKILGLRD